MDTLQARFREKATEIVDKAPTITVALGRGPTFIIETCYVVGTSDELYCIVKPTPAILEAIQDDAYVAFAVNQGFPNQQLQGTGRAFFLGGIDRHPHLREQALAKVPESITFLSTIRNLGVLQILPDHIAVTDDANLGLGPRPVYVPEAALILPSQRRRWLQAIGIASWPLAVIPVCIAALLANAAAVTVTWWLLWPTLIVALLLLTGTILLATHSGFRRQRQRSQALGSSRLLQEGLLPAPHIYGLGLLCLGVSIILGLFLVGLRGLPLLLIGLLSLVGGLLYAGWPIYLARREFEEEVLFVCLGPLAVLGAYVALTGGVQARPFLVSLPIGLLAASILLAHHLALLPEDTEARHATLAVALGWESTRLLLSLLVSVAYLLTLGLILAGVLPGWGWLTFLSLPLAVRLIWAAWRASETLTDRLRVLDLQAGHVYLAFGVLLMLGLVLE